MQTAEEYQHIRTEHDKHFTVLQNLTKRYGDAAKIPDLHERVTERAKCREGMEMARAALDFYMGQM